MKNGKSTIVVALCAMSLAGCGLVPHQVELFQKKVQPIPTKTTAAQESERQAAALVTDRLDAARDAALVEHASTNVTQPLTEARGVAYGLRYSLGEPLSPWTGPSEVLAARLSRLEAKLDRKVDDAAAKQAPLIGKKIEGTGLIQVPYFLWVGIVIGGLWLLWQALKIGGMLYPPLGVGVAGLSSVGRVSASVATHGFQQVVAGGEAFKEALKKSGYPDEIKAGVIDLFRRHQLATQDQSVQAVVRDLTK